jgi:hypothetical protein
MHGEPEPDERREISYGSFLKGYLLLMVSLVVVTIGGEEWLGIDAYRSAFVLCGGLFALAGIGVPRKLYLVVRSTGWFSFIEDPRVMRGLLVLLGVVLILAGFFASTASLHS